MGVVDVNSYMELKSMTAYESKVLLSDVSGCLNSPTLMYIMLSNGGGCFEFPNPNGYQVE